MGTGPLFQGDLSSDGVQVDDPWGTLDQNGWAVSDPVGKQAEVSCMKLSSYSFVGSTALREAGEWLCPPMKRKKGKEGACPEDLQPAATGGGGQTVGTNKQVDLKGK